MEFNSKDHCVYYHKSGDLVFYVGMGRITRPFSLVQRNSTWEAVVKNCKGHFTIEVVKIFKDYERVEAKRFERQEIMRLKPVANQKLC